MRMLKLSALLTLLLLLVAGCAGNSPAVGTWAGTVKAGSSAPNNMMGMATMMLGSMLNGPCTLQLDAGGKGFLKVASLPERPVNWSESGGKVVLRADEAPPANNTAEKSEQSNSLVGTLTPDNQTMTLDFGVASAQLKKQ